MSVAILAAFSIADNSVLSADVTNCQQQTSSDNEYIKNTMLPVW